MAKGNTNINPIEEARRYAREVIDQAHETAIEADEPTKGMYEFDAIVIDDEECDVAEIVIMHDDDTERYALVERPRPNAALIREAEKEMRIGDPPAADRIEGDDALHGVRDRGRARRRLGGRHRNGILVHENPPSRGGRRR